MPRSALLLPLVLVLAAAAAAPQPWRSPLRGIAVDAATGAGAEDLELRFASPGGALESLRTGAGGAIEGREPFPAGPLEIDVRDPFWKLHLGTLSADHGPDVETLRLQVRMGPSLRFTVGGPRVPPASGLVARVQERGPGERFVPWRGAQPREHEERLWIPYPPRPWSAERGAQLELWVESASGDLAGRAPFERPEGNSVELHVELRPVVTTLGGRVVDAEGRPLQGGDLASAAPGGWPHVRSGAPHGARRRRTRGHPCPGSVDLRLRRGERLRRTGPCRTRLGRGPRAARGRVAAGLRLALRHDHDPLVLGQGRRIFRGVGGERCLVVAPGHLPLDGVLAAGAPDGAGVRTCELRLQRGFGLLLRGQRAEAFGTGIGESVARWRVLADGVQVAQSDAHGLAVVALAAPPERLEIDAPGWIVLPSPSLADGRSTGSGGLEWLQMVRR